MATHKLLLLAGDGIGPEVMAEVKKLIAWMNARKHGRVRDRGRAGRRLLLRRPQGRHHRRHHGEGARLRRRDLRRGRRAEVGRRALRRAAGGRAPAAAQGPRPVRQHPSGDLLSGAGGVLEPQARGGRRARHHHPARIDRRGLFRRAEDHHRSRQRPEACHRHAGLRHLRDRAHLPRRLRAGEQAPQQGDLDGEAQRHEDGRALARGGAAGARPRVQGASRWSISSPMPAACSWCVGPSSST